MAWDITIPADSAAANTIHTLIQTAKGDISTLGKCTNDDAWEEHTWLTGRHKQSQVGWVAALTPGFPLVSNDVNGVMYWDSTSTDVYLQIEGTKHQVATMDHNDLTERSEDDHTQYYLRDGTRPMEEDLTLETGKTWTFTNTASTESDSCMFASHTALSWSAAHAGTDGGLKNRHFADASIEDPAIRTSAKTYISSTGLNCFGPAENSSNRLNNRNFADASIEDPAIRTSAKMYFVDGRTFQGTGSIVMREWA